MKKYFNQMIPAVLISMLIFSSCKKFGDVNIDPHKSSGLDPALQLANVQLRYSGNFEVNEKVSTILTMPFIQHTAGIYLVKTGQFYIKNRGYTSALWNVNYGNDILNIVDAVERSQGDPSKTNINAACRIMKVLLFARMTDLYGDIPYKQAGKGYKDGIIRPEFDTQESIYNDFFKELTEASAQLDPSKDQLKGDLFYNGNISAWKKFANSLRLRYAMRLVKRNPEKAKAEAQAAFAAGLISSHEEICKLMHENVQSKDDDARGNSVAVTINSAELPPKVTTTLIAQFVKTNDPRLKNMIRCYTEINSKPFDRIDVTDLVVAEIGYVGVKPASYSYNDWLNPLPVQIPGFGEKRLTNAEQKAEFANYLIKSDAPFLHFTHAEVEFLLAEANIRFGLNMGGDAKSHYEKGIAAAMKQLSLFQGAPPITETQVMNFINSNKLIPGKEIEMINEQLWLALIFNGQEAYANWRRTDFPKLIPGVMAESNSKEIPRRLEYPLEETEQNAANVAKAVQALGGLDDWTKRVWWDKQ